MGGVLQSHYTSYVSRCCCCKSILVHLYLPTATLRLRAPSQSKVIKRYYLSVEQFVEDMNVIFANAQFFNEESSRIWKDARIMQVRDFPLGRMKHYRH